MRFAWIALAFGISLQAQPCNYSFTLGGQTVSGVAVATASVTISPAVVATAGCAWNISGLPDWIASTSSGVGDGPVTLTITANGGGPRAATITAGSASFTVEQAAATPVLNLLSTMPHIAAQDVWNTTFTFVNKGTSAAQQQILLLNDTGGGQPLYLTFPQITPSIAPIRGSLLVRTLPANASLVIKTAGPQVPPVLVGSTRISAAGSVDGFAIFHLIPGLQEAVVPLETRNAGSYVLAFDNTGGVVLGVAVQNITAPAVDIPVTIRDDAGTAISPQGATLPTLAAFGHTSFVLSQLFPATASKRGTIEFTTPPGSRISVLGIRTTPVNNTLTLTTVPALADVGITGGSIAHIATGNGWQTTFVLINTGTSAAQAALKFFADQTGAPLSIPLSFPQAGGGASATANSITRTLAAGASLIIQSAAPASDPAPTIGSAQLTTDGKVGGFVVFRYNPNGQEAVVPLESRTANGYLIAFDNTNGTATGLAVNSVSSQTVNVPVIVRDDAGNQIATDTLALAANGHIAFTLGTDKFPVTVGKRGTIEFVSGQIGALGIRIPPALTFTTLPALAK